MARPMTIWWEYNYSRLKCDAMARSQNGWWAAQTVEEMCKRVDLWSYVVKRSKCQNYCPISILTFLPGFLPLPEEGDPDPAGQHDHGVEAAAPRPDDPAGVLRDPQWLHQQLQVLAMWSFLRHSSDHLTREMVKYEGRQGKEKDLEQFSEAINIIR